MKVLYAITFLSALVFIVSGCTSENSSKTVPTSDEMTDKIHQSESNYNNAVNDVVDLRNDLDGYDLGI